ncbi:MAG: hypothetical protein L7U47_04940, partial [Alphaproteobacteria bacterium]|nr:hypothetical protein [Alphaproteobacteria bacterium]
VEDPPFFALVNDMLNGTKTAEIDPASLSTIHITLMDAAHHEIPLEGMAILPPEMAQSTVALRYLGPDARMLSTFNALNLGLIDAEQAAKLWRNIAVDALPAEQALARHVGAPDGLTTAMAWRALDAEQSAKRLPLIAAAMDVDLANGNGSFMRLLYTELAEAGMGFDQVERTLSEDQSDAAGKIALLLALGNPNAPDLPMSFPAFAYALNAAKILSSLEGDSWRNGDLAAANQWHLMPILEAAGMVADQSEWLDQAFAEPVVSGESVSLSPLLSRAIQQASEKRRVAETILLANWLFGDLPLAKINTQDAAVVITALNDIGQNAAANALVRELVIAHLLANTGGADMSASTGAWIFPVSMPVSETAPTASDQPEDGTPDVTEEGADAVDNATTEPADADNDTGSDPDNTSLTSDAPSLDGEPDNGSQS